MVAKFANDNGPRLGTNFLLLAQFGGRAVIPIDEVQAHFFSHLTVPQLLRKVTTGAVGLPVMRLEASQKCAKGVHLQDMADYLDAVRASAVKEVQRVAA